MLNRSEIFAKPEVKKAIATIRDALRGALPEGSFGEREAQALAINNEALRLLLREELQAISDSFGDEVLSSQRRPAQVSRAGPTRTTSLCGPLRSAARAIG